MTIEESTTIESTDELEDEGSVFGTDESTLEDVDGADGADDSADDSADDDETPEVKAAREAVIEARKIFEQARETEHKDQQIKAFRELKSDEARDGFLSTSFKSEEDRDSFREQVTEIELTERIEGLIAGDDDSLVAGYKAADEDVQKALLEELQENPDRLRMLVTRADERVVTAPTPEPPAEGEEEQPIDFREIFNQSLIRSSMGDVNDVARFAKSGLAAMNKNTLAVEPALREELAEAIAYADKFPDGNPHRVDALERAAGIVSYVRSEAAANEPMTTITKTTQLVRPDGKYVIRSFDDRGKFRDEVVDEPVFASDEGLTKDRIEPDADVDYENMPVEQAMRLGPTGWAKFREANPDAAEEALRAASAAMTEASMAARRAGNL